MKLAFILILSTVISSPSVASFMPECGLPSKAISNEADEPSSDYLQTMVRIELEGDAVAARVLRGALGFKLLIRECDPEPGKFLALSPQE